MCSRIVTTGFHTLIPDDEDDLVRTTATLHEAARRINQIGDIDADRRLSQTAGLDPAKRINQTGELDPRISVSPALLIDMLTCLYFIMFNGQAGPGAQAVVDIHYRACYELLPDVLLVTNAIRNSLRENPSGQPDDGPIGLSLALSPASSNYTLSKTAITNASFRAKKLPDDIPVQPDESGKLPTISEDDTSSKTKTSKTKQAKKDKTGDRSKAKESRTNSGMNNSIISISDQSSDNLTVAVIKGQQRNSVDSIEMAGFIKTKETTSNKSRDSIDGGSSPFIAKHVTASSAKTGSGMKTSISNKDIKNAKQTSGHSRNLSGDSAASENQSTDL
ncbi:HYCCI-like protein [Mya arenaria]|uniref:HYCCI-like protein n=2 Tax=Mya arenaria TaxID=6604 RepID=A0ABY7EIW1_MYAAR|nr:HYCCI-like protein [Mya arenaria]